MKKNAKTIDVCVNTYCVNFNLKPYFPLILFWSVLLCVLEKHQNNVEYFIIFYPQEMQK